jgi:hypothetical protein
MTDPRALIAPALMAAGIACFGMAAMCSRPASGADDTYRPTARFVLWDETADRPWTTPRGNTVTPTNATACLLAMSDAVQVAPSGTRLSCRRSPK